MASAPVKDYQLKGEDVRRYCDERGIKYSFVARKIGVCDATFWTMLNGHIPSRVAVLKRLAEFMGTEVDSLLIPKERETA